MARLSQTNRGDIVAALTFATLQTALQAIIARTPAPWTVVDAAFAELYPQAISYTENRIYHEMPFLAQRLQDTSLSTVGGERSVSLAGTVLPIVVPQRLALLTPAGSSLSDGQQIPLIPVSLDFIDMFWPNQSQTWAPASALAAYWCIEGGVSTQDYTSPNVIIAPTPDDDYTIVLTGLFRQAQLGAGGSHGGGNLSPTYLSTNYPELMIAGCMIFLSGALLRNYSAAGSPQQPDEPGMPVHWEGQFQRLMEIAKEEEMRRLQQGTNWMNRPPMPAGAPPGRPAA